MPFFRQKQQNQYPNYKQEVLLIDRLVDDISENLLGEDSTDLNKIKSALFDIVVLTRLLKKIGIKAELQGAIKDIRDSISHIDERLESFNFQPTTIIGKSWQYEENSDKTFKLSKSYNFQGAISMARIGTNGSVQAIGPYGMIDDAFIWINRSGKQKHTLIKQIRNEYSFYIESALQASNKVK